MLLSDSISRRYTPPTCTLEINAQTSALSRWTRRPVVKQLQFQLSFDNLLRPDDQPVQVSGDRAQLDLLREVVEAYVQKLLNQSSGGLPSSLTAAAVADQFGVEPSSDDGAETSVTIPGSLDRDVYLQPVSLLAHDLCLGSLATETSGSVIRLSTSQLFDLASALEEYATEAIALPIKQRSGVAWVQGTPIWARTAAIAVVAVGITTAALQLTNNSNTISQRTQPSPTPPPAVPPPPPPGSTPLPPPIPTVPIPSNLPSIEPPPSMSPGAVPKSSQPAENPQVAVNPAPVPTPNQSIVVQPRSSSAKQTTIGQAESKSDTSSTGEDTSKTNSAPTAESQQPSETAFDTIPQVAEVRSYFQQRWQPPKGLKQSLQYTLILNSDGSIRGSLPRSQVAETYVDRTPIPLANEPFVSAVEDGGNPKIRVVLDPSGDVETFLESSK